ncbi:MAG: hypothetical protein IPL86_13480 [Flavobacteriales bacterium]|nr:hypothetical protein [Flavobacteriales bacterium]
MDANVIEGKRAYYFMNYGFSVAAAINKPFGEHVQWINNTRFFETVSTGTTSTCNSATW